MKQMKHHKTQGRRGLLTLPEVAAATGVSRITAWRWAKSGMLRGYQMGRSWRVFAGDLEAFIRKSSNRKRARP
jgi:excisionase family DNA binding protein